MLNGIVYSTKCTQLSSYYHIPDISAKNNFFKFVYVFQNDNLKESVLCFHI